MSKTTIEMNLSKSTKNTHVYADDTLDPPIPTIYIKKTHFPDTPPQQIKITIEYD